LRPKEKPKARTLHYVIDSGLSRFTVQAFAGGLLSGFAHNPRFAVRGISSDVRVNPQDLERAAVRIEIHANSLELLDEMSDKDRREIRRVTREEVLEAATYPTITFESTGVSKDKTIDGQHSLTLAGDLSLHGATRPLSLPLRVAFVGDILHAVGEFSLKQTDYGIKPVAVAGGVIKVKNELKLSFDLAARRRE